MKINYFFVIIVLTLMLQNNLNGQNLFFIGNKSFPSSGSFSLIVGNNSSHETLSCLVAKNGAVGFFVISKETMTGSIIKGNAIIYLDDGSVITLIDKGRRDYVDRTSTNIYNLTLDEIGKLKNSIINSVRFTIKCPLPHCDSSEDGSFTAKNTTSGYGLFEKGGINTRSYFSELF